MHILFLFLDGIGLGDDDPETNPFAAADLPTLHNLTNGKRWLRDIGRQESERAIFIPTDPRMGIAGRPQSGSNQAAMLTGKNIPQMIGKHYGPKPNEDIRKILDEDNFFITVKEHGKKAAMLDAYPPRLLHDIQRGKTLPSSNQYAAIASGQELFTIDDLRQRKAITAEYTGEAWHKHLKLTDTPIYTEQEAGHLLVELSRQYDFAFHSFWMTDFVGHRGTLEEGIELLKLFDGVMIGVLEAWDDDEGLIIVSSDHGNMEKIGDRRHTENDVPTLIIGNEKDAFAEGFSQSKDFVPRMSKLLFG